MGTAELTATGIAFERSGPRGDVPILLIHAAVADRRMWDAQWPRLTAQRDVVRVDLRGFGASTRRPNGALSHLNDVSETLTEIGIDSCHVAGASIGAGVATELALSGAAEVQTLLLCPPGGSLIAEFTPDFREFAETERGALARQDLDAAVEANISAWIIGPGRQPGQVDQAVQDAVRRMQRLVFEVTAGWDDVEEADVEPPALDRLSDLACPVQVLVGAHDLAAIHDSAARVCAAIPGAIRTDWPDAAHVPSMEHPERFADLLSQWITASEPS